MLTLRGSEKHAYERCREWVRRCGRPLYLIVHEYVEAAAILKGMSVIEAARFCAQCQCHAVVPKTVPDIVNELLVHLTRKGKSKFYVRDQRVRLGAFAKAHQCPLNTVSGKNIGLCSSKLKGGSALPEQCLAGNRHLVFVRQESRLCSPGPRRNQ